MKKLHIKKVLAMFLAVALVVPSSASNLTASAATKQESNDEREIPEGYTQIYDAADLYAIRNDLEGNYIMMADIDLSEATAPGGFPGRSGYRERCPFSASCRLFGRDAL